MPVYDSANFHLTYLRVTPGSRVGQIDIQCQEAPGGTTDASVTYTFTALSEQGNAFTASRGRLAINSTAPFAFGTI